MSKLVKKPWKGTIWAESLEKNLVLCENQTYDPLISSLDALDSELLETLGLAGSKVNYNYTSHILITKCYCDKKKKKKKRVKGQGTQKI